MKRNQLPLVLVLTLVSVAFFFIGITASAETDKETAPVLDSTTKATTRYLPVVFASHDKHANAYRIGCTQCHHDIEKPDEKPAACKRCHNEPGSEVDLKKAMHTSCLGCHKSIAAKNAGSKGPITCLGCHRERR